MIRSEAIFVATGITDSALVQVLGIHMDLLLWSL